MYVFCLYCCKFGVHEAVKSFGWVENKLNLPDIGVLARDLHEQNGKSCLCYNYFKGTLCKVKSCRVRSTYASGAILVNIRCVLGCYLLSLDLNYWSIGYRYDWVQVGQGIEAQYPKQNVGKLNCLFLISNLFWQFYGQHYYIWCHQNSENSKKFGVKCFIERIKWYYGLWLTSSISNINISC